MKGLARRPRRSTGLIAPDSVQVFRNRLRAGSQFCQTLYAKHFPSHVEAGCLTPLLCHAGEIDVALHVEPIPNQVAATRLKTHRTRHLATVRSNEAQGRLTDPEVEAAARGAGELMASMASGEGRLFHLGLYVTVKARSQETLDEEVAKVIALCASMGFDVRPVELREEDPWISTLPIATDKLGLRRVFDTRSLANLFPFVSADVESDGGVFYGRNSATGGVVVLDRFALDNYNQVVLAHSGKGKSYFAKLQVLRSLYQGIEALVVDPENEYGRLAESVGGAAIRLGGSGDRLNPLDLGYGGEPDALIHQSLFVHSVFECLLGKIPQAHKAALDRAILDAYASAGVSADPRTHSRPAPLLKDVVESLRRNGGESLAGRMEPYTVGSQKVLFDGPTTARPEGHLVVFSLRDLPEDLKPLATMIVLESIWKRVVRGERRPRLVVIDEAWLLLQSPAGARFLERLARSARKYWCGLTTITQDVRDALSTDIGRTVVTNAASQVLFGQHPQALDALAEAFSLSEGERSYLASCPAGKGLLCVGSERATLDVVASEKEHRLVTTSPEFLATLENSADGGAQ